MNESTHEHPCKYPFAKTLGVFSIGLGLAELLIPKGLAHFIGVKNRPGLFAALGLREIASGVAILSQRKPTTSMWSRVAGDIMDLSLLGTAYASEKTDHQRIHSAAAFVAGVTIADVICAVQLSRTGSSKGIHVEKTILINRSPEEIYWFWRDLENLPQFMHHLESVRITGEKTSHWMAKVVAGKSVEWDAMIINDQPATMIAWETLPGADVHQAGSVHFDPAPQGNGTMVRIKIQFYPPGGALGETVVKLCGPDPAQQVESDLNRLRSVLEAGIAPE